MMFSALIEASCHAPGSDIGVHIQLLDCLRKLFLGRLDVDAGGIQRGMSQQTHETDQIPWMGGKIVGHKGMAEPMGAYLSWDALARPHQLVDHPSHGRNTQMASLLTDPEWTSGMGGPG